MIRRRLCVLSAWTAQGRRQSRGGTRTREPSRSQTATVCLQPEAEVVYLNCTHTTVDPSSRETGRDPALTICKNRFYKELSVCIKMKHEGMRIGSRGMFVEAQVGEVLLDEEGTS